MQAYHSQIRDYSSSVGNMAILPLRTQSRGPAPIVPGLQQDVIDESLYYFKANVFFRTYEIKVIPPNPRSSSPPPKLTEAASRRWIAC